MADDKNGVSLLGSNNRPLFNFSSWDGSSVNTNSSSATGSWGYGAANTGNSSKSIWETLIGNTSGILAGTGSLITAIKADPNRIAQYQGNLNNNLGNWFNNGGNQNAPRNNNWIWIVVVVLILLGLAYWAMKGGKAA